MTADGNILTTIEPVEHECTINFLFAKYGLQPYFAVDATLKENDSWARKGQFEDPAGRTWDVTLYKTDGNGLVHPGDETPSGTPFRMQDVREYRLKVERTSTEDEAGQQSFNAHISPRWQGMETENKYGDVREMNIPDGLDEGLNVKVQGSNIDMEHYHPLLRYGFDAVGVSKYYFKSPHPYSNIQQTELYVRIDKDESGPIHARDGPLARLSHLLENDRSGVRKIEQTDDDDHGNNLPGYRHMVTIGEKRVKKAFPGHRYPKTAKHYYAREAAQKANSDPLANPKLGVYYQPSLWDETVYLDDMDQLKRELEETLLSILHAADIPIRPPRNEGGSGPYVKDAYFDADVKTHSADDAPIKELNLTQIEQEQENVLIRTLARTGGLSPVERESLETLVSDGGEVSPMDIAEENDRHVGSVRRALRRLEELVDREYDRVAIKSHHMSNMLRDAIEAANDAIDRAVRTAAAAEEAAERGLSEEERELLMWAEDMDIDLDATGDAVDIDFGKVEDPENDPASTAYDRVKNELKKGWRLWKAVGRDPMRFRKGEYYAQVPDSTGGWEVRKGDLWRLMRAW